MGQYFLASVGVAEAFRKVNGVRQHFFSAKTLTDSSINISVSAEEVRGGPGAQLLGQFFHTSTFGLTMTDAIFKLEYIAAQVGSVIEQGGYGLVDKTAAKEPAAGQLTLDTTDGSVTIADPLYDFEGAGALVWYNLPGQSDYTAAVVDENGKFVIPHAEGTLADEYCVHYYADKAEARKLVVSSEFIPAEFEVLLTTRLFAGDASAPETGKPVGSVTVRIPRFQLNGTLDLSMEMASAATISLEGTALAYDDSCDGAKYAEIVEFVSTSVYAGYTALAADADALAVGDVPVVYAVGAKKVPMLINNDELTFTPALENGRIKETLKKIEMALPDGTTIVQDFLQTVASVSEYKEEIMLGDDPFTFANPDLKIKQAGDTYTLTGTIANYTGDLEAWGFEPPTTHIFALKLVVEDAGEDVSIVLKGTNHTKNIGKSAFDGDDFIYLVLDGNTKQYTITCKATAENTAKVITIDNKASLGA